MRRERIRVYCYKTYCIDCKKRFEVYYTASDFGYEPILMRCKKCGEYYLYSLEDEEYQRPLEQQLEGVNCLKCGVCLYDNLVRTHEAINCCGYEFSLNNDFADGKIPPNNEMVELDAYMTVSYTHLRAHET